VNISTDDGPVVVFRDSWASGPNEPDPPETRANRGWADYCRAREKAERAAAKCASSLAARRVHQELAQAYAALLGIDIR
jgi:hypothetical protein